MTLTRCPTWFGSCSLFVASTTWIETARFFRKPDFQLRDFGASAPVVFSSRNVSASRARHPVIDTGASCASAFDAAFVLILLELGRVFLRPPDETRSRLTIARARVLPLLTTAGVGAVTYLAVLFGLDLIVAPIGGAGNCTTVPSGFHNPIEHTNFMLCYAGKLTSPNGPTGIASYPWQWLLNQTTIDYYKVATTVTANGATIATIPIIWFQGAMNPAIILLALPALGLAIRTAWEQRDTFSMLCVVWFLGTFLPFVVAAAPLGKYGNRDSYIYYMVIVLPAVYAAVAAFFSRRWLPIAALLGYVAIVGFWFVQLYPFRTWSGH